MHRMRHDDAQGFLWPGRSEEPFRANVSTTSVDPPRTTPRPALRRPGQKAQAVKASGGQK